MAVTAKKTACHAGETGKALAIAASATMPYPKPTKTIMAFNKTSIKGLTESCMAKLLLIEFPYSYQTYRLLVN